LELRGRVGEVRSKAHLPEGGTGEISDRCRKMFEWLLSETEWHRADGLVWLRWVLVQVAVGTGGEICSEVVGGRRTRSEAAESATSLNSPSPHRPTTLRANPVPPVTWDLKHASY
jgi:hypothetical protein